MISTTFISLLINRNCSLKCAQWHCWSSWWRIHDCINYAWFICSFRRNRSSNSTEAIRIILWDQGKGLNLAKVIPHQQWRIKPTDVGLLFGVPQGSVLRPNNYCIYTKPVGEIIKLYNIKYHCYADDTQVYITLKPCDKWNIISSSIEAYIADISTWMNSNMLKLNKDKT